MDSQWICRRGGKKPAQDGILKDKYVGAHALSAPRSPYRTVLEQGLPATTFYSFARRDSNRDTKVDATITHARLLLHCTRPTRAR